MEVIQGAKTYSEENGIIFIPNAISDRYTLRVYGKSLGQYEVDIWQIGMEEDNWTNIQGKITKIPAESQVDTYTVDFRADRPFNYPINQNNPESIFKLIEVKLRNSNEEKSLKSFLLAHDLYLKGLTIPASENLLKTQNFILTEIYLKQTNITKLIDVLADLENLYSFIAAKENLPSSLSHELEKHRQQLDIVKDIISNKEDALFIPIIEEKLFRVEKALKENKLNYAYILLQSIEKFEKMLNKS